MKKSTELAERYGVAGMTIQQAMRLLRDEGLSVSRQGSGVFVRERTARATALRPNIERAFAQPKVTVDFAGFCGETLHGVIQEPLTRSAAASSRPTASNDLTAPGAGGRSGHRLTMHCSRVR